MFSVEYTKIMLREQGSAIEKINLKINSNKNVAE